MTDQNKIKVKRYCEYVFCFSKHRKLTKFTKTFDRGCRFMHKNCLKSMPVWADDLIKPNPLNIKYSQCIATKLSTGERCKCDSNSDGFDTKTGYCKYHNKLKYWLIHG